MLKSDIIFWSSIFFIVSWVVGFYIDIKMMFLTWVIWSATFVYIKILQEFD